MFRSVRVHGWFFLVKKRLALPVVAGVQRIGTMASADFSGHKPGYPGCPAFRASPTHGYAAEISPDKGCELSLHKCANYPGVCRERLCGPRATRLRSLKAFMAFLFVTSQLWRECGDQE